MEPGGEGPRESDPSVAVRRFRRSVLTGVPIVAIVIGVLWIQAPVLFGSWHLLVMLIIVAGVVIVDVFNYVVVATWIGRSAAIRRP